MKHTPQFLSRLEDIFAESDYMLRYEKGNFKAGWCLLRSTKVVVVNKYFPTEGKINCLVDILRSIPLNTGTLGEKSQKLYQEITKSQPA
ncbi:MAG TPA: hypothetical protein VF646_20365 [Cytophagales bacterium]|jgi:hypothetical protein